MLLALVLGCSPERSDRGRPEDSITSGMLRIAAEPDVAATVRATTDAFVSLYPAANIQVVTRSSREAMADVFENRADLAVIGREVEPIEREAATRAGIEMEAYRWAREGVAVVVHPANPVNQVAFEDLQEMLSGESPTWADVGGADRRVLPVLQDPERGLSQYVARVLLERESIPGQAITVAGDSATLATVGRTLDAIGFVGQSRLGPGVKVLSVARARGMPYVALDAESVYDRDYPLTRSLQIVTRVPGVPLAQGWITYATSDDGQRFVRDEGFVPATVPVKFTRRAPLAPSHREARPAREATERKEQR